MRRIRLFILIFVCCCVCVVNAYPDVPNPDPQKVLENIEKTMAQVKTIQTDFIQEKDLSFFNQKIILKGKVFIQKPGLLSWRVFTPLRYTLVIKGSLISQWDEETNKVQKVSLAQNPSFQAAIAQMQNWFSGSFTSMRKDYAISLVSAHPVTLEFIPLEDSLPRNFIQRVIVRFEDDQRYIKEIRIEEKNKDSTVLTFTNAVLNRAIDDAAWEVKADVR